MKGAAQGGSSRTKRLPVFISPEELQFVGEDEASHKQILTLFNPYNFNIRFKVLSNAPHKYSVYQSQGTLSPRCCTDLVVCHRLAANGPYDVSDKFKIELFYDHRGSSKPIGRKQVISTLLKSKSGHQSFDDPMADELADCVSLPVSSYTHLPSSGRRARSGSGGALLVLGALACLLILLLPLQGEQPDWPSYLHITVNQKLIAAFALGLLTLAILKS